MDRSRFARVRELLVGALEQPADRRAAWLDEQAAGDAALREEVASLLAHEDDPRRLRTAAPLAAAGEDLLGTLAGDAGAPSQVGPYTLHEELGRGGMGVVYRAEQQEPLRREVALKLVKRGMDTDAILQRFHAERQVLARMEHPNIARVLDAGATGDGRPYFVMELVRGERITRWCDGRSLGPRARLELFGELCRAVQHAHQRGVLHRDLKPSNVLVHETAEGPRVKVIDFGIARAIEEDEAGGTRMTVAGQILGTPEYMSPEQAGLVGAPVDTRSDVYALGAMLYELLSGRAPYHFERYSAEDIQRTLREHDPPRPSTAISELSGGGHSAEEIGRRRSLSPERLRRELAGDLDNIVLMAMHRDPERRYPSVDALADDLRRYREGLPVRARPDSLAYRSSKFLRRNALGVGLAAAAFVALAGFSAWSVWQNQRLQAERARATAEAETAREVTDFLVDIFYVSDPDEARGRDITAEEVLAEGARRIRTELTGRPVVRARLMNTIGAVYQNLGLYDEAREQIEASLALRRAELGPDHPEVAEGLVQMAWLLREEGRDAEAKPLLEEALRIRRARHPRGDESINEALSHLASVHEALGDLPEAVRLHERVLELDRSLLGEDDPQIGESLNNVAVAKMAVGAYAEAESLYRLSVAANRRALGDDHPETATSIANLSNVVFQYGDREEGLALAQEAVALRRQLLGEDHPHTAIAEGNLGIKLYQLERYDEATAMLERSLRSRQASVGERHPSTAHAWILMGLTQLGSGDFGGAEHSYRQSLSIYREALPPGHNNTGRALEGLGRALLGQGRVEAAGPLLEESWEIRRAALPEGHRERHDATLRLGQQRLEAGRLDEARPLLEAAWRGYGGAGVGASARARDAARLLARLHGLRGDAAAQEEFLGHAGDPGS